MSTLGWWAPHHGPLSPAPRIACGPSRTLGLGHHGQHGAAALPWHSWCLAPGTGLGYSPAPHTGRFEQFGGRDSPSGVGGGGGRHGGLHPCARGCTGGSIIHGIHKLFTQNMDFQHPNFYAFPTPTSFTRVVHSPHSWSVQGAGEAFSQAKDQWWMWGPYPTQDCHPHPLNTGLLSPPGSSQGVEASSGEDCELKKQMTRELCCILHFVFILGGCCARAHAWCSDVLVQLKIWGTQGRCWWTFLGRDPQARVTLVLCCVGAVPEPLVTPWWPREQAGSSRLKQEWSSTYMVRANGAEPGAAWGAGGAAGPCPHLVRQCLKIIQTFRSCLSSCKASCSEENLSSCHKKYHTFHRASWDPWDMSPVCMTALLDNNISKGPEK